jgi:hypothetical protein
MLNHVLNHIRSRSQKLQPESSFIAPVVSVTPPSRIPDESKPEMNVVVPVEPVSTIPPSVIETPVSEPVLEVKPEIPVENKSKEVKPRKEKARETDDKRLAARQKQLDIGKNTVGYQKYLESTPHVDRRKGDPRTPDKHQVCSKRSWDGQVRKWRRQLHFYDPDEVLEDLDLEDEGISKGKKLTINLGEIFALSSTAVVV